MGICPYELTISLVGRGLVSRRISSIHRYHGRPAACGMSPLRQSLRHACGVPPPFTQGRLWVGCNHTATNNPCRGDSRRLRHIARKYHSFHRYHGRRNASPTKNNIPRRGGVSPPEISFISPILRAICRKRRESPLRQSLRHASRATSLYTREALGWLQPYGNQ